MASEIAMNAKWNHMVSEKIRVSRTSNITVASATRNSAGPRPRGAALGSGAIAGPEGPLHEHAVDPAAELEAHGAQCARAQETARRVHADRRLVRAVADHGDDLPVAEVRAAPDQLVEQPLADAAAGHVVPDVDRVLERVAVGAARAVRRAVTVAGDVDAVFSDQVGQAAPADLAEAALELFHRGRLLLEGREAVPHVVRVDRVDRRQVLE